MYSQISTDVPRAQPFIRFVLVRLDSSSIRVNPLTAGGEQAEKDVTKAHGYTHLLVPSKRYPMNTKMTGFRCFQKKILLLLCLGRN